MKAETAENELCPSEPPPWLERRVAPLMFGLSFFWLLVVAGMIHRASAKDIYPIELTIMQIGLASLWPVFVAEAIIGYLRRSSEVSRRKAIFRVILVLAFPAFRMAWIHPATNKIWLPRLGWHPPGKPLLKTLDKIFGVPMLFFAFLILPVLGAEYVVPQQVRDVPGFLLARDVSIALIWLAFATEFVIKITASPNPLRYVKERWIDLAIVVLPTLEFILTHWVDAAPLARMLRLSRAIAPEQLAKLGQMYRLRGLLMKGWHAFMLLEGVTRLIGNTKEKRLEKLERQIAELEEDLAELRREADELRQAIAERDAAEKAASAQG